MSDDRIRRSDGEPERPNGRDGEQPDAATAGEGRNPRDYLANRGESASPLGGLLGPDDPADTGSLLSHRRRFELRRQDLQLAAADGDWREVTRIIEQMEATHPQSVEDFHITACREATRRREWSIAEGHANAISSSATVREIQLDLIRQAKRAWEQGAGDQDARGSQQSHWLDRVDAPDGGWVAYAEAAIEAGKGPPDHRMPRHEVKERLERAGRGCVDGWDWDGVDRIIALMGQACPTSQDDLRIYAIGQAITSSHFWDVADRYVADLTTTEAVKQLWAGRVERAKIQDL